VEDLVGALLVTVFEGKRSFFEETNVGAAELKNLRHA